MPVGGKLILKGGLQVKVRTGPGTTCYRAAVQASGGSRAAGRSHDMQFHVHLLRFSQHSFVRLMTDFSPASS
jgi:DNA-binding FadR family transcriptional regulator